jgi:uncharacterized protein with GYD domain
MAAAYRPHRRPKLTEDNVRAIRSTPAYATTAKQLATEYGVHFRTIEKVRSGETWSQK